VRYSKASCWPHVACGLVSQTTSHCRRCSLGTQRGRLLTRKVVDQYYLLLSEGNKVCIQMSFRKITKRGTRGKVRMLLGIPPRPMPATLLAALLVVYSMAIVSVSSWIPHTLYLRRCSTHVLENLYTERRSPPYDSTSAA